MRKRLLGLGAAVVMIAAACGSATSSTAPSTAPGASTAPGSSTAPAGSAAAGEQTLTFPLDSDLSGGLSNAADNVPTAEANLWLYDALYDYDASLNVFPQLAAKPAEISADGLTWTLTLKDGIKFTDGTPMTADDVVQSFQLAASENCTYNPSICLSTFLDKDKIEKVDDKTVKFTLKQKLATFATVFLPGIFIENKKVIDASYARYAEATKAVTPAEVKAFLDKVAAEEKTPTGPPAEGTTDPTVNYTQFTAEAEALLTKAGQTLADKTVYTTDGVLDESSYTQDNIARITAINKTFTAGAIDALAAAYKFLDIQLKPEGLGSGPFKFGSLKAGESVEFENNPDYFDGASTISKIFLPIIKDDIAGGQALAAGQVDWKYSITGPTYQQIKDNPNLQFAEYPDFGYFGLYLNQREGALFSDKNLRQALDYCFDKEATAKAATDNNGVAIYSEIPPASWAYPKDGLNTYAMDPAKSKSLIESSGWTLGSDGIYEKGGKKLSTIVAVRAGRPDRSKWMQLMSDQVKQCGIDIQYKEIDFNSLLNMINNYPHINVADPSKNKPFDAYFGGFSSTYDPDPFAVYHSSQCSTAEKPTTYNYECYKSPEADKLIEDGLVELDQAKRAQIYQQYAVVQSNDLPVIYAWADVAHQGLQKTVNTSDPAGFQMSSIEFQGKMNEITNAK